MMSLFWIAYLCMSHAWAQDAMTFESIDIEGDRKQATWSELGARPQWVMPTPMCIPARFSHHHVSLLQPLPEHEKNKDDAPNKGGRDER